MPGQKKNVYSLLVILVFSGILITFISRTKSSNFLTYDTFGYYLYLPGTFIYHQLEFTDLSQLEALNEKYHFTSTFYQLVRADNSHYLDKYSMGLAYMYLPFFLLAHLIAYLGGWPLDGLSPPYQFTLLAGALLYSILGVFILRKVMLKYFSDAQTAITLVLVIFGTNYIYDALFKGLMAHNLLFTVYAFLLWFTIRWFETRKWKYTILTGLTAGLLILARPSEVVCLAIPLLWGIGGLSKGDLRGQTRFWKENLGHLLVALICILIVWLPQMVLWKVITGNFLYYSYDNPGEGFDFLTPHTWKAVFSFRKGWLIYTPIMAFALVGFYPLFKKNRPLFWPIMVYFILNLYLVSSWTNWWYAQSYGQRALIQSYAIMALPMGYFVQSLYFRKNKWPALFVSLVIAALMALNFFQIWQLTRGILDPYRMTRAYYFATFGKTHVTPEQKKLLLVQRPGTSRDYLTNEEEYSKRPLAQLGFEDKESGRRNSYYDSLVVYEGKYSFRMDSSMAYSPGYEIKYRELTHEDHAWVRATVEIFPTADIAENDALLVMTFSHGRHYYRYKALKLSLPEFNAKPGQWNRITMDYITPEVRSGRDKLSVYVWYRGKKTIYIDDLKLEVFEKK